MSFAKKKDGKTIGEGRKGKCRLCYSEKYKRYVVEKTVGDNFIRTKKGSRSRLKTLMDGYSTNRNSLKKETKFMLLMKIAKLDCCVEILEFASHPFRIIMEYCEGGDLRKILDKYEVPVEDKLHMITYIIIALERIHRFGVIHGDLKCENIFLANKYKPGDYKNIKIKIGDFGLSEIGGDLVYGGTPGFMAPEVPIEGGSFESDIYSIGKVMLEIMTQLPVQMIQAINGSNIYSLKNKLPRLLDINKFYDIVIPCLNSDKRKRPTARELCKMLHMILKLCIIADDMNRTMLSNYKLGEIVPVDIHCHPLTLSNDDMRHYKGGGWYCSICQNKKHPYFNNILSFHCSKCHYDLCDRCILLHDYRIINDKMEERTPKGKKVYVSVHPHYLLLTGKEERQTEKDNGWTCNICKTSACDSVYSFNCKDCGYNVCSRCFETHFQVREEKCSCCSIF